MAIQRSHIKLEIQSSFFILQNSLGEDTVGCDDNKANSL